MTENISLCLKTTQINASDDFDIYLGTTISTSTGQVANNRTSYTWYNVNLRNLLDPIYAKYNKFNISLNSVITSIQGTLPSAVNDRSLQVKMSGLMWLSSYNQAYQRNDPNKVIKLILFNKAANLADCFQFTEQYHTFLKGSDTVNITINLHNVDTDTYTDTIEAQELLPHMIFNFNIQGVPENLNDRLSIEQKSTTHINDVKTLR